MRTLFKPSLFITGMLSATLIQAQTDAKANEFFDKIIKDPYRSTVYLYTSDYDDPLYDNKLMHCRVVADSCDVNKSNEKANWNTVRAVFEEV